MSAKSPRRRRGGWRRKGRKLQAYVWVHRGKGGLRTRTYDLGTAPSEMQTWIDDTHRRYRRRHPRGAKGTLAGDVETYLKLLIDRPRLQQNRQLQLAWWCDRFGTQSRWTLQAIDLETALNALRASGKAASTVKKYRTALYHLFTKLDGKNEPNPLRDVPPHREPEALPRALPYAIIDGILQCIPDQRYARTLTEAAAAQIRQALAAPRPNVSAIARAHGISETAVRKIRDGRDRAKRDEASATKVGLRVMAYLGWSPAMVRAFRVEDYDAATTSVLVRGRTKGEGTRAVRLQLVSPGVAALVAWIAIGAPTFSVSSWDRAWRRGVVRFCAILAADPQTVALATRLERELATVTPYALRHSFLTEVQLATGSITTTQSYALHADARMTRRYTLAAVAPELLAAAPLIAARFVGQRAGNEPPPHMARPGRKRPKNARAKTRRTMAKAGAKPRRIA